MDSPKENFADDVRKDFPDITEEIIDSMWTRVCSAYEEGYSDHEQNQPRCQEYSDLIRRTHSH